MLWILSIMMLGAVLGCSKKSVEAQESNSDTTYFAAGVDTTMTYDGKQPGTYVLSKGSRFEVKTEKAGVLGTFAHNHVIRAQAFSGEMIYDAENLLDSHFEITVMAEGLEVLTAAKPSDLGKIREAMLTKVLKAKQYPNITFVSRKVERTQNGVRIVGDLTLVGQARPESVDVALSQRGDSLFARGTFSVRQTDFGIKPYSAGMGTIKVADQVTFDFEAVGTR